jgi:5,5'-dehydrodivanillate O-demethylase
MISEGENQELMQVGPGSLMGELMRRYWMPIAAAEELVDNPIKQMRLMGEDLVLYRDKEGNHGLLDLHCAHRRADLSYGIQDEHGLRCNYHGWLYDHTGACLEQPFEEVAYPDAKFKERIKIKAYPIEEKAGMLWAYMGPGEPPLVPDYDRFYDKGYKQVVYTTIPCNWFQCQENSIDPVHVEWLHGRWSRVLGVGRRGPEPQAHAKVGFDEFEHGIIYRRVFEGGTEEEEQWTVGRVCLWPNALYVGHFEWRVPIDDETTLSVAWFNVPVPGDEPFEQERIPYWTSPLTDEDTGRWIDTHVMNQDFIAWVGQGALADRTQEHLGGSDSGIIMMRRRMLEEARVVADGGEPKCVYRDPETNQKLYLPRQGRAREEQGLPPGFRNPDPSKAPRNVHLARQPQWILDEMDKIWEERGGSAVSSIGTAIE